MTRSEPTLTRRKLLASVVTGATVALAGCSCESYDDELHVRVERLFGGDDGVRGRIRVVNPGTDEAPTASDRETYATTYRDVTLLGYDRNRREVVRVDVGDLAPGSERKREFDADAPPVVLTADASAVESDYEGDGCPAADTGAPIHGYLGRFEGEPTRTMDSYPNRGNTHQGENGHRWMFLERRRVDGDLPPRQWVFDNLACRQRRWTQSDDYPSPDLSLVPAAEAHAEQPIPEPTVRHHYDVLVRQTTDNERDHEVTPERTLSLDRFPERVRVAIREDRSVGWVAREEFFDVVSYVERESITSVERLPACDRTAVNCTDTRGIECRPGTASYGGKYGWYLSYFVEHGDTVYLVGASYEERWLAPDAGQPSPCTDERAEEFAVHVYDSEDRYRGLDSAIEGEALTRHFREEIARVTASDVNYPSFESSRSQWLRAVAALEGLDEPGVPDCSWPNVSCTRNGRIRCGAGSTTAFYHVTIDGRTWWLRLVYEWRRLPESKESSEPKRSSPVDW